MPVPIRAYLDTSVVSAYFDPRDPTRQELTQRAWVELSRFQPVISELVRQEIGMTQDDSRRREMLDLVESLPSLPSSGETTALVDAYLTAGVFTPAMHADATHVAIAVSAAVPILLSWNFRHLVNRSRRIRVNLVNSQ